MSRIHWVVRGTGTPKDDPFTGVRCTGFTDGGEEETPGHVQDGLSDHREGDPGP